MGRVRVLGWGGCQAPFAAFNSRIHDPSGFGHRENLFVAPCWPIGPRCPMSCCKLRGSHMLLPLIHVWQTSCCKVYPILLHFSVVSRLVVRGAYMRVCVFFRFTCLGVCVFVRVIRNRLGCKFARLKSPDLVFRHVGSFFDRCLFG